MADTINTHLNPSAFQDVGTLGELLKNYVDIDLTPYMQQALAEYKVATEASDKAITAEAALTARLAEVRSELATLTEQHDAAVASDAAALLAGKSDIDFGAYGARTAKIGMLRKVIEHGHEIAIPDAIAAKLEAERDFLYSVAIGNAWACIAAGVERTKKLTAVADSIGETAFAGPSGKTFDLMMATQRHFAAYGRVAQNLHDYRARQAELRAKIKAVK